jgi:predicted nucleotidyltransferase
VSAPHTLRLRALLAKVRPAAGKRGATNPRIFGSVAAGTAVDDSDIDLIVDFPGASPGSQLMSAAGLTAEPSEPLGVDVDVLVLQYAKDKVAQSIRGGELIPAVSPAL